MKQAVQKQKLDMLSGPLWNKIPQFALPVAATAILEQLFNASDIAVVGNFSGAASTIAVAAVGANSFVISLVVNFFIGIALGANVVIADVSLPRLHELSVTMPPNVDTLYSSYHNIVAELKDVDIVIGSVLIPGDITPKLITRDMLKLMEPGTVLVDVAIDQGGCFETSHATTHSDPVYELDGIVHYAVANIPGAVPNTSTAALTNATMRYALALADKGWKKACADDEALKKGLNVVDGKVVYKGVADAWGLPYTPVEEVL